MRSLLLSACLVWNVATVASAQVSITKSAGGWELTNGHIRLELDRTAGSVHLKSLRREGGAEWAVAGTPLLASPDKAGTPYHYGDDAISDQAKGGKQLTLRFQSDAGGLLSLELKLNPTGTVIQTAIHLENHGQQDLLLNPRIDPLFLTLKNPAGGLKPYTSSKGQHGFHPGTAASHCASSCSLSSSFARARAAVFRLARMTWISPANPGAHTNRRPPRSTPRR